MPLHLLHHKSYHVYNAENVARVRRDEAEAAANAQAAADLAASEAARDRLELLRSRAAGKSSPPPAPRMAANKHVTLGGNDKDNNDSDDNDDRPRKKARTEAQRKLDRHIDRTGLTDKSGHINLFPPPLPSVQKNAEAEKERKEKEAEWEARNFHNALGRPCDELKPWYTTREDVSESVRSSRKRGGEWEQKKEERRKDWADPLILVNTGVRRLREVEEGREEWKRGRERDVGGDGGVLADDTRIESVFRQRGDGRGRGWNRGERQEQRRDVREKKRGRHRDHHDDRSPDHRSSRSRSRQRTHRRHHRSDTHHSETPDERLAKLRAEREKRERAEGERAKELLWREKQREIPGWKPVSGGRYSKQFGVD